MATATLTRQTKARTKAATSRRYYSLEQTGSEASINIYGDVTSWPWLESDVSAYNLSKQIEDLDVDTINVGINSYGGEVAEGLAIYNALKRHKAKVRTRCDGFACSVASVIFAAGDERVMSESSLLMIHNAWTSACGDANELRKQADDLEKINEASVKAYMSITSVDEEELRALMDEETWISPEDAVDMGLATSIEASGQEDKPAQSVKRKVMQMLLRNPYQLEDDPDGPSRRRDPEAPDDDPEDTDGVTEEPGSDDGSDDDAGDGTGGDSTDPGDGTTEDPDPEQDPDGTNPDDEDDEQNGASQMLRFLTAIQHM